MNRMMRLTSGFVLMLGVGLASAATAPGTGTVLATVGSVSLQRAGQQLPATRETALQEHDEVQTGEHARAHLKLADGTITTLGANTRFRIHRYRWQPGHAGPNEAQFELVSGAFRTITGALLQQSDARFEVKTPTGLLGIRGTDFWGGYLDGQDVDVFLIDGSHALTVTNASGTVTLEKAGQGTTLKADQSALQVNTWGAARIERATTTVAWPMAEQAPDGVFQAEQVPTLTLPDQHGEQHQLNPQQAHILLIHDMTGARLLREVFAEHTDMLAEGQWAAIANLSDMNGFIREHLTLPSLRQRPYRLWIDTAGVTDELPIQPEQVTALEVHDGVITEIRYAANAASLRKLVGLPPE